MQGRITISGRGQVINLRLQLLKSEMPRGGFGSGKLPQFRDKICGEHDALPNPHPSKISRAGFRQR